MVGKLPEKTKPTIMIVSDDKARRKAALQMVKSKKILDNYPGFELGHCSVAAEFEDLKQLGSDSASSALGINSADDSEGAEWTDDESKPGTEMVSLLETGVCGEALNAAVPTTIYFHTSPKSHSHGLASATCGDLFRYKDTVYALTMAHAIRPTRHPIESPSPRSEPSSQSDDCEITGMEDWDDDDDDADTKTLTAITSPGRKTSSEFSDSEESLLKCYDSQLLSEVGMRTRLNTGPPVIDEEHDLKAYGYDYDYECNFDYDYNFEYEYEDEDDTHEFCERIGSVVGVDEALDVAVIKTPLAASTVYPNYVKDIYDYIYGELGVHDRPTNTTITIGTTRSIRIPGQYCQTPFYTRLPGIGAFIKLYSAKL